MIFLSLTSHHFFFLPYFSDKSLSFNFIVGVVLSYAESLGFSVIIGNNNWFPADHDSAKDL